MDPEEQKTNGEDSAAAGSTNTEPASSSSLEGGDTNSLESSDVSTTGKIVDKPTAQGPKEPIFQRILHKINVYLLMFLFLLLVAGAIILITYLANKKQQDSTVKTQSLTQDTLKQLATTDVTVGQPKQILSVQSNAVFAGKVLIRDSLEVAGPIQVGGSLSVPGITVSGNSIFEQIQVNKNLSVQGDASVQGKLAVQKSLTVAGGATFGGVISAPAITVNALQLNGNLTLTRHFAVGGATPGRTAGSALGGGGTVAVSGSDTAGSININTGTGPAAGCFVTVNFNTKYNSTPYVLITPIGSSAASIDYYVNRTTANFSVCAVSTPPSTSSFGFDYFVLE